MYFKLQDVPESVTSLMTDSWVASFANKDSAAAGEALATRWCDVHQPEFAGMVRLLLQFRPTGIVIGPRNKCFLHAQRTNSDDEAIGNSIFVPGPVPRDTIDEALAMSNLGGVPLLREFVGNFGGLSEDPNGPGTFVGLPPWQVVDRSWEGMIQPYPESVGALIVFCGRDGSRVLIDQSGRLGWWSFGDLTNPKIEWTWAGLKDFIDFYTEYRVSGLPFYRYGRPS
jgi:hypothetical protein